MKLRKENNKLYLTIKYNPLFTDKLKRRTGAKWQPATKEWVIEEEFEDKMNNMLLKEYGFSCRESKKMKIEFIANDFSHEEYRSETISVDGFLFVKRPSRDWHPDLYHNGIILEGGFPKSGGSSAYPCVEAFEGTKLRFEITEELYNAFSEESKNKITVVSEFNEKESLLKRKEELLKELAEIEEKLSKM